MKHIISNGITIDGANEQVVEKIQKQVDEFAIGLLSKHEAELEEAGTPLAGFIKERTKSGSIHYELYCQEEKKKKTVQEQINDFVQSLSPDERRQFEKLRDSRDVFQFIGNLIGFCFSTGKKKKSNNH